MRVVAVYTNKGIPEVYKIENDEGQFENKTEKEMHELLSIAPMENSHLVKCEDKELIFTESNVRKVSRYAQNYRLVGKLLDATGNVSGYVCKDYDNKQVKMTGAQLWQFALNDSVDGVEATITSGVKTLKGEVLGKIPTMTGEARPTKV